MCILFVTLTNKENIRFEGDDLIRALGMLLARHKETTIKTIEIHFSSREEDIALFKRSKL